MKPILVVMAAGMGSRYGGLKQLDALGPGGETIIDYSVFDAIKAGFGKVVFIIRESFADVFREGTDAKFADKIETAYVCQELGKCVGDFEVPAERQKPWGTGHAILCAKDEINRPFAVINADDFYGFEAFEIMRDFLVKSAAAANEYAMVGYVLRNTLSDHGHVSRGVCRYDERMFLKTLVERTKIERAGAGAKYYDTDGGERFLTGDELVSMNFWGFKVSLLEHLEKQFRDFLAERGDDIKAEFFIPMVIDRLIADRVVNVKVLATGSRWFGVTYREDKALAIEAIGELIAEGAYPAKMG